MTMMQRRDFIKTTTLAGFALAAQPVVASTIISTDTEGLVANQSTVATANGALPVYWARPSKGKDWPVVLVIQEIFGVHEHIKDVTRRLAKQGYLAIAPELFFREGDPAKVADTQVLLRELVAKVGDTQVLSDLDAVLAWAVASQQGSPDKQAITGFCWGGRITWLYAAHNPRIKAGIAWYGRLSGDKNPNNPQHPLDIAKQLKVPVLGLYGGADTGIPLTQVDAMKAAIAGTASQIQVFADAPHAFHADYRPNYRAEAAKQGWQQLLDWLKKYL